MRFAQRYYDLESFATAFISYLTTNMARLAIPQRELDKFTAPKTESVRLRTA